MTRLLILLSLLASGIGWGCATDLAATATPPTRSVKVELQLSPDPAERITRAADAESRFPLIFFGNNIKFYLG